MRLAGEVQLSGPASLSDGPAPGPSSATAQPRAAKAARGEVCPLLNLPFPLLEECLLQMGQCERWVQGAVASRGAGPYDERVQCGRSVGHAVL